MKLDSKSSAIVAAGIALMIIAVAAMITASYVNTTPTEKVGKFEKAVKMFDSAGLHVSAVSLGDLYGVDYQRAAILCPGETNESVAAKYRIDPKELHLPANGISQHHNYIMLGSVHGHIALERLDRDTIDLCSRPVEETFGAHELLAVVKGIDDVWRLPGA
ncbi:hypothetical protein CMUST_02795 [Corynebacterium mustelae]|uniref:Uncharacterized protein n=1 Tax=Corynebacterium mustelae TaxID=571915 RepID=A0A0G3GZC0_9CORY|nr:hypothetical protein [Corynebacterium mustelae]AKK04903.1 hypothetical protein CMUST_02795 [Corynebacterium mustelae]